MAKKTKKTGKSKSTAKKAGKSRKDTTRKKADKSRRKSKPVEEADDDEEPKARTSTGKSKSRSGGGFYARTRKKMKRTQKRMRNRSEYWKPEEGKNYFRPILFTDKKGNEELYVENARHWRCPAGGKDKAIVRCKGEDCPICEILPDLPDDLQDNFNGVGPSVSLLMNGIVRGKDSDKLVIAEFPMSVVVGKNGMEAFLDEDDPDFVDVFDPDEGYDFVIIKEKSDKGRISYSVRLANKPSALGMDVKPRDLTELVNKFEDDKLYKTIVDNLLDEEDARGRTARKKRAEDDDSDDEEYDEDEDDGEEDEDDDTEDDD